MIYGFGNKSWKIETFAGKGTHTEYRKAEEYAKKYGGKVKDCQHTKGHGWIETKDGRAYAEVHWSQCKGVGKFDFFIKEWLDESDAEDDGNI